MVNELLTKARDEVKQTLMLIVYSFKKKTGGKMEWAKSDFGIPNVVFTLASVLKPHLVN